MTDWLAHAQVTVFGGQWGHMRDDPDSNAEFFGGLWGASDTMLDWEVNDGEGDLPQRQRVVQT